MTQMDPYQRGRRDGIRWAITWLHEEAKKMNDPMARSVLNNAAFHIGVALSKSDEGAPDAGHDEAPSGSSSTRGK